MSFGPFTFEPDRLAINATLEEVFFQVCTLIVVLWVFEWLVLKAFGHNSAGIITIFGLGVAAIYLAPGFFSPEVVWIEIAVYAAVVVCIMCATLYWADRRG